MAEIVPATMRDMTWITAQLRPCDAEELFCQRHTADTRSLALSVFECSPEHRYVARTDGPVCAFGANEYQPGVWSAWAFGTNGMRRAVPTVSRFIRNQMIPALLHRGANRVEARSIANHDTAHRWLLSLGARCECHLPMFGKDGQDFKQFAWTRKEFEHVSDVETQSSTAPARPSRAQRRGSTG